MSEVLGGQGAERLGDPKGGSALAPRSFPKRGPHAWRAWRAGPACGVGAGRTTPPGLPCPRGGAVSHAARAVPGAAGRLGAAGAAGLGDRR